MKNKKTKKLNWSPKEHAMFQEEAERDYIEKEEEGATPIRRAPSQSEKKRIQRKKKKRRKKHYILKFFLLVIIGIGVYSFAHSDVFNIKKIDVSESERFQSEQIQEMCGLKTGINLFEFSAGDCEDKLLENPYIKEAEISRKLPGSVKIKLKERKETASLLKDSAYIVIDEDMIVLRTSQELPQVPLLDGITVEKAEENHMVQVKEGKVLETGMMFLKKMEAADLYFKKVSVSGNQVKAFVTDDLYCRGKTENLVIGMEDGGLKAVIYELYKNKIKKGIVYVGDEQYYAFDKLKKEKKAK